MEKTRFTIQARAKSFGYAFRGIRIFLLREHNAWLHIAATFVVIALSLAFKISSTEWMAIVFAIGLVWVTEILNTCIEKIMDFISLQEDPRIKLIKDMAAGAVLLASATALIIGLIVFTPRLIS